MAIKYISVLFVNIFMLQMNVVCHAEQSHQSSASSYYTFTQAVNTWESKSCIFPDKSLYRLNKLDVVPKLNLCQLFEGKPDSEDDRFKTALCQFFYTLSINLCSNETYNDFVANCLSPAALQKITPFENTGTDVCTFVFSFSVNQRRDYFGFFLNPDLCKHNCVSSGGNSVKDVCELYASIIYQDLHRDKCMPPKVSSHAQENATVSKTNSHNEAVTTKPTEKLLEDKDVQSKPAPKFFNSSPPSVEKVDVESTSASQTPHQEVFSKTEITPTAEMTTQIVPGDVLIDDESTKRLGAKITPSSTEAPPQDTHTQLNEDELKKSTPPAVIAQVTSTVRSTMSTTMKSTLQIQEVTSSKTSITIDYNTTPDKDYDPEDDGDNLNGDDSIDEEKEPPRDDDHSNHNNSPQVNGVKDSGSNLPKVNPEESGEVGEHVRVKGSNVITYDTVEESPGSGHFLAYFLTAVVICISGYVIYHNKQKILAFIIEGRNGGRGGRQRSQDVKYTQLKSNVEEVMPSLDQTATSKNFVY